ncbi:MAG: 4-alpha-glucanotransferase [Ignavibacteria bacterium]|nr:4-alpha-glucanotransferase [Ignavibacteria bacterium]
MNTDQFKYSRTSEKWEKIGIRKRAGVALPLFSVYSSKSTGIGEIPDLRYLIDWCEATGLSILQLLPLNETGNDFSPYSAISTFAIDPVYICIRRLRKTDLTPFRKELRELKKNFPKKNIKVNYDIRNEKLKLLRKIFDSEYSSGSEKLDRFVTDNIQWLKYYALFKILSGFHQGKAWQDWEWKYKYLSSVNAERILKQNAKEVRFYYWVQWQLYEQLITVKKYADRKKIFIMGDIPFLVSKNSADVWAYKNYFKLDLSSGAPPDMYFSKGQRWGMPPYNWFNIAADNYAYIRHRLKYAENFYNMFRIDHFVGLFRIWSIENKTPIEYGGMTGHFDPENENEWEHHGRTILSEMNQSTDMLPCAEDLGTVPVCSDKILKEFGVTGISVQRWEKTPALNYNFIPPERYRSNSVSVLSTHDSSPLPAWYETEAGSTDEDSFRKFFQGNGFSEERISELKSKLFNPAKSSGAKLYWKKEIANVYELLNIIELSYDHAKEFVDSYLSGYSEKIKYCRYIGYEGNKEMPVTAEFINRSIKKIFECNSIFSIQLMQEYLYLDKEFLNNYSSADYRINSPGTVNDQNWTMRIPMPLEEILSLQINPVLKKLVRDSDRLVQ